MRTNIEIDDVLLKKVMRLSGAKTKKAAVEEALRTLVRIKGQGDVRKLFGKVQWEGEPKGSREKNKWAEAEARDRASAANGRAAGKTAA